MTTRVIKWVHKLETHKITWICRIAWLSVYVALTQCRAIACMGIIISLISCQICMIDLWYTCYFSYACHVTLYKAEKSYTLIPFSIPSLSLEPSLSFQNNSVWCTCVGYDCVNSDPCNGCDSNNNNDVITLTITIAMTIPMQLQYSNSDCMRL